MPRWWTWQYANPFYWLVRLVMATIVVAVEWLVVKAWHEAEEDHWRAQRRRERRRLEAR